MLKKYFLRHYMYILDYIHINNINGEKLDVFNQGLLGCKLPNNHTYSKELIESWQHGYELSGYYHIDTLHLDYELYQLDKKK